ncbi:hypothetical protein Hanom_Chr13g01202691 [Helianthus anomalus]
MHLNQLASSSTPIFFGGWIYRFFKTYVQRMPKSFRKGPWSGKEKLLCTRNTYNMASNTFTRVGAMERSISTIQENIIYIREHMVYQGEEDEDGDMD